MKKYKKLNNMLEYSIQNVPFYRREYSDLKDILNSEDALLKLPLLEKNEAITNINDLISQEYYLYPQNEKIVNRRTSGSTGKSLKIFWDINDDKYSMMPLWFLRKKYYDILPDDKLCYFFSFEDEDIQGENRKIVLDKFGKYIGINKNMLNKKEINEACQSIIGFNPKWIITQPSIASIISDWFEQNNSKLVDLKYVELTGELLSNEILNKILRAFGCKVANQYGCNEANSIAYECPEGNMHCLDTNVIVEVLNNNGNPCDFGKEGNIYITTLNNHCMPFIRYGVGDKGRMYPSNCLCGNRSAILQVSVGRETDFIRNRDGTRGNIYAFIKPIIVINDKFGDVILQFQIRQESYEDFQVVIILNRQFANWSVSVENMYYEYLDIDQKENKKFDFVFLENLLPDNQTGKVKNFICEF